MRTNDLTRVIGERGRVIEQLCAMRSMAETEVQRAREHHKWSLRDEDSPEVVAMHQEIIGMTEAALANAEAAIIQAARMLQFELDIEFRKLEAGK